MFGADNSMFQVFGFATGEMEGLPGARSVRNRGWRPGSNPNANDLLDLFPDHPMIQSKPSQNLRQRAAFRFEQAEQHVFRADKIVMKQTRFRPGEFQRLSRGWVEIAQGWKRHTASGNEAL